MSLLASLVGGAMLTGTACSSSDDASSPDVDASTAAADASTSTTSDSSSTSPPTCTKTICGSTCVDTQVDPSNCGACGTACAASEVCTQGACALDCQGSTTKCGNACVDLQADGTNCGECGKACDADHVCSLGKCELSCSGPLVACNGACVNPTTSQAYCGATAGCGADGGTAGVACGVDHACTGGNCVLDCPANKVDCNDACIDPLTTAAYCGATNGCGGDAGSAGTACDGAQACKGGACTPQTFTLTGADQPFVVPTGITAITFEIWGAQGGADGAVPGGKGGYVTGTLAVTPGETLHLFVGGQGTAGPGSGQNCNLAGGFNGGGATGTTCCSNAGAGAGAGGGASDIRQGGDTLAHRVAVGAGGGGAGNNESGGAGGGDVGGSGGEYAGVTTTGGTQSAGGSLGGHYDAHACSIGTSGVLGQGGLGDGNDGGGGGGGYYGGGGGPNNGGGGGGSSFTHPTQVTGGSTQTGLREGNGQIILSW